MMSGTEARRLDTAAGQVAEQLTALFRPLRIYLFGSAARGEAGPDSDLDFLVVMPDGTPREKMSAAEFYRNKRGIPYPVDVVLWRRSDFEGRLDLQASLPATVVREGKLLYDAG